MGLKITGNQSSGSGGGIQYTGTGILTLTNVLVTANTANKCGGIDFEGPDTSPGNLVELVLGTDAQITSNTAQTDGGGVCISGVSSLLQMQSSGTSVASNSAPNASGGGIAVFGADAYLDAPDASGTPQIYQNTAKDGGGIAITCR